MNSLQSLCVLCSRLSECALELECLRFCDPVTLIPDMTNFRKNGVVIIHLFKTLFAELCHQNFNCASPVTIYLQILLKAMYNQVLLLDASIHQFLLDNDKQKYFENIFQLNECKQHLKLDLALNNYLTFSVDISTINDIEKLLCKMNCIFGLISPLDGINACSQIIEFLTILCGVCVVMKPEVFSETTTCLKCYEELSLVPNQGKSIRKRLAGKFCNHLTETHMVSNLEKNVDIIEKDLDFSTKQYGLVKEYMAKITNIFQQQLYSKPPHLQEAENTLINFDLFSKIPDTIYSLSEFTYWSKISESVIQKASITLNQLNLCHSLYADLQNEISKFLYGETIQDVFNFNEENVTNDDKLYIGSRFISPCRLVDIITNVSIKNLEEDPVFTKLAEEDEIQTKIKTLLNELENSAHETVPKKYVTHSMTQDHNLQQEIHIRKKAYYQKISESGYSKVMLCIKEQEALINKLMNINILGNHIFESLSKMMNAFANRQLQSLGNFSADPFTYDDHLYIKNNLLSKKLPQELLPNLSQEMYRLLTGPLSNYHTASFPLSSNISMAYACDVADFLPHMKEDLAKCVEGTIYPENWMLCTYNKFFNFDGLHNINDMQRQMWNFIRELVLSVALYNDVFGKQLSIVKFGEETETVEKILLTFDSGSPLLFKRGTTTTKFNDLYSLLYFDLKTQCDPVQISQTKQVSHIPAPNLLDLCRQNENSIPECFYNF